MATQIYTHENVLCAARRRIAQIFDDFENIIVSISGGKDSTVLAHLCLKEAHARSRRIGIFFLDEEVMYESTIKQVDYIMHLYPENTVKYWLQIEFNLTNSLSFDQPYLRCWEAGKHKLWMRPKREDAIKFPPWPKELEVIRNKDIGFCFYSVLDSFERMHHKTAFLVGLRAVESPNRWRAMTKNPGYSDCYYSTKSINGNVRIYPIYDWNFGDVWKYLYDEQVQYSKIYDFQHKKGMKLSEIRVSSLIHEKSFKSLVELPEFEPKTYNKLLKRVKGIQTGHLYGKESKLLKCRKRPKAFKSWREYRNFLLSTYPDAEKKLIFERRFSRQLDNRFVARQQCRQLILNDYENNLPIRNEEDPRNALIAMYKECL